MVGSDEQILCVSRGSERENKWCADILLILKHNNCE